MKKSRPLRLIGILIVIQIFFLYFVGYIDTHGKSYGNTASPERVVPSSLLGYKVVSPQNANEMIKLFEQQDSISKDSRRVFFAHVGKTGGESIRTSLRVNCKFLGNRRNRRLCWQRLYDAFYGPNTTFPGEPVLSQLTRGFMHYNSLNPEGENYKATHFLFSLRHPVDRLQSWYRYISPANCAGVKIKNTAASCRVAWEIKEDPSSFQAHFFSCFPTIQTFLQVLQRYIEHEATLLSNSTALECAKMLVLLLQGKTGSHMAGHMIANLQYYHHFTLGSSPISPWGKMTVKNRGNGSDRDAKVMVARTDSLWDDLEKVDKVLGGNGYFSQAGLKISHQSEHFKDMAILDSNKTLPLCCVLSDEIAIYKELIERCINLSEREKQATLKQALKICNVNSWNDMISKCGLTNDQSSLLHRPEFSPSL
jgi:hypothetical protein